MVRFMQYDDARAIWPAHILTSTGCRGHAAAQDSQLLSQSRVFFVPATDCATHTALTQYLPVVSTAGVLHQTAASQAAADASGCGVVSSSKASDD